MADTGHSVLLKYFIDRSNMSEIKPDVESSVPNNQELRDSSNLEQNTVDELENAVYSPVITVTTEETTLTKGDLKVHKVVVSEDVSDDSMKMNRSTRIIETKGTNDDSRVESKVYITLTSEQASYTTDNEKGVNGSDNQKSSRKTRIPKRKFKQALEKIKKEEEIIQERIMYDEPNIDIKVKSSIPRLKEMKHTILKQNEDSQKLDDEFDKLYEEIKDNNVDVTISTPESLRDDEIVDSIFEEIIHAYDEKSEISTEKVYINTENIENNNDKIERITEKVQISPAEKKNTKKEGNSSAKVETNTEKVKSKIPLLKRKSEQEIKLPLNRRSSLKKSISIDDTKVPIQSKSTAKNVLAKTKSNCEKSETCSTIDKLESDSGTKIESFESKTIIKTIKSQQSIEMERSNVSSKDLTTTSNEVSKCKIPVKSQTKDKVEKLNSATLNKLPAKSNIIGKIVHQHTSEVSKSSLGTKAGETHRVSRNLIEKALRDHKEETTDIKNIEKVEEKVANQQILDLENQSMINTENKISQNGISVSENSLISSNEIQETSHSTNSRTIERSFTVTNTQWDKVTKNLPVSNENNHINMDLASMKNNEEINESINDNSIITQISKTDMGSQTIKTTEIKETIRVSTLEYDSSIDFKTEITTQNEIRDSENNLNDSNIKMKEKETISNVISKEIQNEIKSNMKELVKSGESNNIRAEPNLIDIQKKDNPSQFKSNEATENKTSIDIKTKSENTNKAKYDSKEINNNKILETKAYPTNTFDSFNSNLKTESESKRTNKVITQTIANRIESITGSMNKPDTIKEYKVTTNQSLNIDNDKFKDSKVTDSVTLNVNNKNSSQTLNIDELNEEDIIILRGKVNRIISRLDSREVKIEKTEDDIPKNVSIVSKIAIFENKEPENLKNDLQNLTTNTNDDYRPKIVDEIRKSNENINNDKTITKDTIFNIYDDNKEKKFDYHTVFNKVHSSVLRRLKSLEMNANINLKDIINQENLKDKVINQNKSKPNEEEKREVKKVDDNLSKINEEEQRKMNRKEDNKKEMIKDEYNRTKSLAELHFERDGHRNTFDDKDKKKLQEEKRAKSLAELDLGNVLKGRVKQMVHRMNSIEQVNKERRELERNRPRRLVLSKAAVFEKKAVPDRVENLTKTDIDRSNDKPLERDQVNEVQLQARIAELNSAKAKYGKWENMPTIELRDGSLMPVLAVGTALLEPKLIKHIIAAAIDLGYRAIDTAFIYGNEKEIGEAIRSKIEDGTVKREDLFIISKLWSTFHRRDLVEAACRHSLDTMGLEYFDLYMIHNPMSFREGPNPLPKIANVLQYSQYDYLEAWYGMESVVAKGLVKRVGLSNFNSAQVDRVMEKAKIKPVINQVECHPYLTQHNLEDFCTTRNMKLSCFGVLGSKGTPKELKSATSAVIDDALVQVMAAGLGVTPAQLLIAYQLHHGRNVVVKSSTGAHLWDNLRALDLKLDQTQVSALDALNKNKRTFTFKGMGDTHKNYPFKIAF